MPELDKPYSIYRIWSVRRWGTPRWTTFSNRLMWLQLLDPRNRVVRHTHSPSWSWRWLVESAASGPSLSNQHAVWNWGLWWHPERTIVPVDAWRSWAPYSSTWCGRTAPATSAACWLGSWWFQISPLLHSQTRPTDYALACCCWGEVSIS